jgi:hypothetical protein
MAQAESVPSPISCAITGARPIPSTRRAQLIRRLLVGRSERACAVGFATGALLLGWFPWNVLLILFLFLCRGSKCGRPA